jgi:hypothetical protein
MTYISAPLLKLVANVQFRGRLSKSRGGEHSQSNRVESCKEISWPKHAEDSIAFQWSGLTAIHVPASIEVLYKWRFVDCESPASVTFELDLKLQRIEESAFQSSGLTAIHVPASVEVLCK